MKLIDELNAVAVKIADLEEYVIKGEAERDRIADESEARLKRAEAAERKLREADAGFWVTADDLIAANERAEIAEAKASTEGETAQFWKRLLVDAESALAAIVATATNVDAATISIRDAAKRWVKAPVPEAVAPPVAEVSEYPTNEPAPAPTEYTDDHQAILKGLTGEFQTVLELHKSAKVHGFSKGDQTVRNYMLRDIMPFADKRGTIVQRDKPLGWKLTDKPKGDKPETVEETATTKPGFKLTYHASNDTVADGTKPFWPAYQVGGRDDTQPAAWTVFEGRAERTPAFAKLLAGFTGRYCLQGVNEYGPDHVKLAPGVYQVRHALVENKADAEALSAFRDGRVAGEGSGFMTYLSGNFTPSAGDPLADLRAAIEKTTGMAVAQDFKAEVVKASVPRDANLPTEHEKMFLNALSETSPMTYADWADDVNAKNGTSYLPHELEGVRARLTRKGWVSKFRGGSGWGRAPHWRRNAERDTSRDEIHAAKDAAAKKRKEDAEA